MVLLTKNMSIITQIKAKSKLTKEEFKAQNPEVYAEVLADGARRARVIAQETLGEVKQKMGLI